MAKGKAANFFARFMKRVRKICYSHHFIIVTGVISLLFLLFYTASITITTVYENNPSAYCGTQFLAFRERILAESIIIQEPNKPEKHQKSIDHDGVTYTFAVYKDGPSSDYFEIAYLALPQDGTYNLRIAFTPSYASLTDKDATSIVTYRVSATLTKADGSFFSDKYKPAIVYSAEADLSIKESDGSFGVKAGDPLLPKGFDEAKATATAKEEIAKLAKVTPTLLNAIGVEDTQRFFKEHEAGKRPSELVFALLALSLLLSFLGAPICIVFFFTWSHQLEEDQRFRLICKGEIRFERLETAVPYREKGDPMPQYEYLAPHIKEKEVGEIEELPHRSNGFETFIEHRHIRPFLGEWVFRGVGLAFIGIATLLTFIGLRLKDNPTVYALLVSGTTYLESLSTTGMFILVIALVGVISETHKGLKLSATVFFALGLGYYLVAGALFTLLDNLIVLDGFAYRLSDILALFTTGNVFLGIGVFAIIGFFLYEDPPEWFINRKLFRSFAAFPTLLAIGSAFFAVLINSGVWVPSLWIRNLLFTRNFEHLIIGVIYEYIIFAFRSVLSKRYGQGKVEEKMGQPAIQFYKNFALVILIAIYTVVFYCLPVERRNAVGLSNHTYIILVTPFFLFYKPAGANHKGRDDVIYYILYVIAMYAPTIIQKGLSIFGLII